MKLNLAFEGLQWVIGKILYNEPLAQTVPPDDFFLISCGMFSFDGPYPIRNDFSRNVPILGKRRAVVRNFTVYQHCRKLGHKRIGNTVHLFHEDVTQGSLPSYPLLQLKQ